MPSEDRLPGETGSVPVEGEERISLPVSQGRREMSDEKKTERSLEDLIQQAGDNALRRMVEERKARNTTNAATMPPRRDHSSRLEATLKDQ